MTSAKTEFFPTRMLCDFCSDEINNRPCAKQEWTPYLQHDFLIVPVDLEKLVVLELLNWQGQLLIVENVGESFLLAVRIRQHVCQSLLHSTAQWLHAWLVVHANSTCE